jgi:hypothetical protein
VNIAAWNKARVSDPTIFSRIALSKAEFYYEPKPNDPKRWRKTWADRVPGGPDAVGGLMDDALWNMRWRARLRRLRLPIPVAGGKLATMINSKIPAIPVFGDMLKWPADKVGEMIDDKIGSAVGGLTNTIIAH